MDPYLEQFWGDVHSSLIVYFRDQINDQLPGDLQARVEEGLMVDTEDYSRRVYPDVHVAERPEQSFPAGLALSNTAVAEPCVVALPSELRTERHIEIIDRNSGNRVVTAIELLSPANKCKGPAREAYLRKQSEYIDGGVNLVDGQGGADFLDGGGAIGGIGPIGRTDIVGTASKWPAGSRIIGSEDDRLQRCRRNRRLIGPLPDGAGQERHRCGAIGVKLDKV